MLTYRQTTGELLEPGGQVLAVCYAGQGIGKNDPNCQSVPNTGPLPQGIYEIGTLATRPHLGPSIDLAPDPSNRMRGRAGFLFHLDNPAHVGDSSDGCIVVPSLDILEAIVSTGETQLHVIA